MKLRKILLSALVAAAMPAVTVWADLPFREHRYDSFKACEVNDSSIVFIGNSITNMGEWWEFFGSHPRVVNRGNSGCFSYEALDQIESILVGRPAKIFVMVGTNDIGGATGDAASIAANARQMIERIHAESPTTEVYITSCFPSTNGVRNTTNLSGVNEALKVVCRETETTYIDLWNDLMGIINGGGLSLDALHLNPKGYRIWCEKIAPLVGLTPVFTDDNMELNAGGQSYSYAMRSQQFGCLPVRSKDILIVGDELVHGGEWHELLHSDRVKSRGTVWGYGGITIPAHTSMLTATLATNPAIKETPEQIYFYVGLNPLNNDAVTVDSMVTDYTAMIQKAIELAPTAKLFLCALTPHPTAARETKTQEFNARLQTLAETLGCTYVDTYTPMTVNGSRDADLINGNGYVTAKGYIRLAQTLAPLMGDDVYATTDEDFATRYALINAREALGSAIVTAKNLTVGTTTGTYTAEGVQPLLDKAAEAMQLLADPEVTIEELNAMADALAPLTTAAEKSLNQPEEGKWYTIQATNRNSKYLTANKDGSLIGGDDATSTGAQWGFEQRTDGSYNIVSRYTGAYLQPAASSPLKTVSSVPSAGWTLSASDASPLYVITSGTVQLNQTGSENGFAIYNWGYGTLAAGSYNLSNAGGQFAVTELADDALSISPDVVSYEPTASTEEANYWHFLYTPLRESRYATEANGALVGAAAATDNTAMWKLVARADGSYDLINRATGNYVLPTAATNSQLTTGTTAPATGWAVTPAATDGYYVITNGTAQFNQTTSYYSYKIFNWGYTAGTATYNTSDTGCQYAFKVIEKEDLIPAAVTAVTAAAASGAPVLYDLGGRRLKTPASRGVYIADGQKRLAQ